MTRKYRHTKSTKTAHNAGPNITTRLRSKSKVGLLVTDELERAFNQCRDTVHRIARDCRAKNRKFRDIEFDLDNDRELCLHGLVTQGRFEPTGVSRVTDIYTKPQFFIDGAGSNDIVQGSIGDCWFLSALSTISASGHLIEKCCVARDEKIGVYGFVFFKNGAWVSVIIDDLLFVNVPKFEELSQAEQLLFQNDKSRYNQTARKGGKYLYFARSGTENETWVPLIEKAYAKLHGDYSALVGGRAAEAIEDLTGGVSSMLVIKDILDIDRFWKEELLRANADRLFGAGYGPLDTTRSGKAYSEVEGLIGGHAYSILRAVEVGGKRFLVMRNPWGESEWKGRWSDGSKEWTSEWLARLPEIGHSFGDDGQFIMEYSDFLERFEDIDKTILFDSSRKMSMEWLRVPVMPPPAAWSFGNVSFNFSISVSTRVLIVLSKLDERYLKGLEGRYLWNLQFLVYKISDENPNLVAESEQAVWWGRSINTEADLEPGNYAVHVRVDGLFKDSVPNQEEFDKRKLARVLTQRSLARSVASNYDSSRDKDNFPISIDTLLGREKTLAVARAKATSVAPSSTPIAGEKPEDAVRDSNAKETKITESTASNEGEQTTKKSARSDGASGDGGEGLSTGKNEKNEEKNVSLKGETKEGKKPEAPLKGSDSSDSSGSDNEGDDSSSSQDDSNKDGGSSPSTARPGGDEQGGADSSGGAPEESGPADIFISLRVYTRGGEQVSIHGTIKEEADKLCAAAVLNDSVS